MFCAMVVCKVSHANYPGARHIAWRGEPPMSHALSHLIPRELHSLQIALRLHQGTEKRKVIMEYII